MRIHYAHRFWIKGWASGSEVLRLMMSMFHASMQPSPLKLAMHLWYFYRNNFTEMSVRSTACTLSCAPLMRGHAYGGVLLNRASVIVLSSFGQLCCRCFTNKAKSFFNILLFCYLMVPSKVCASRIFRIPTHTFKHSTNIVG